MPSSRRLREDEEQEGDGEGEAPRRRQSAPLLWLLLLWLGWLWSSFSLPLHAGLALSWGRLLLPPPPSRREEEEGEGEGDLFGWVVGGCGQGGGGMSQTSLVCEVTPNPSTIPTHRRTMVGLLLRRIGAVAGTIVVGGAAGDSTSVMVRVCRRKWGWVVVERGKKGRGCCLSMAVPPCHTRDEGRAAAPQVLDEAASNDLCMCASWFGGSRA